MKRWQFFDLIRRVSELTQITDPQSHQPAEIALKTLSVHFQIRLVVAQIQNNNRLAA
ncbi:MAG: hypothetical protein L0Y75_09955 [Acidobacteria bacterium]|nr:hypothetical protein [Acidobacteriota bacterium]